MNKKVDRKTHGFMTRRLTVFKAYKEDAKDISRLYGIPIIAKRKIIEENWRRLLEEGENDFYKDVTFVVRDRSDKVIGVVETESSDQESISIGIWIPNDSKRRRYLTEIIESMEEWCEIDNYRMISVIRLITGVNTSKIIFKEIKRNISIAS